MASIEDPDPARISFNLGHTRPWHGIIPELDADVLEAICGSIDDTHGLLTVSLTCSIMWRIAIRLLLRTHTIHLTSQKAIRGFREFILNQKPTRAHQIRSLRVVIPPEIARVPQLFPRIGEVIAGSNDVDQLMDVLDCAVNLNNLDLSLADNFRADSARISSAFAGMSALRYLSLVDRSQHWANHALIALQSPLRTLCVRVVGDAEFDFVPSPPTGPFFQMFLRFSSSSTLTNLCLDQVPVFDNSFLDLPQFRSVRSLTITKPLEREFTLKSLLHLFPSLDGTLSLHLHFRAAMLLVRDSGRFLEVQEENRRAQDVSQWTGLDRLDCNLETAAMLALRCPVRHLTTDSLDVKHIVNIRPKHLVISSLQLPFYFSHPRLRPQKPATTGSSPTHIVVLSSFDSKSYPTSSILFEKPHNLRWDIAFERLIQDLSLFHDVTHVHLVFHCNQEYPREVELDDFIHEIRDRASVGLHLVTTPRLLAACPKLRYFFITVCGRDTQSSQRGWIHAYGWRMVGPEERAQSGDGHHGESAPAMLEELSDHTARRVIEDEDLGLPEEWERKLEACRT